MYRPLGCRPRCRSLVDFTALQLMSIDYSESKNMLQKDSKTRELDLKLHVAWIERRLERISLAGCLAMTSACTKRAKKGWIFLAPFVPRAKIHTWRRRDTRRFPVGFRRVKRNAPSPELGFGREVWYWVSYDALIDFTAMVGRVNSALLINRNL